MKLKFRRNKHLLLAAAILIVGSLNLSQAEVKGFFYDVSLPLQNWFWRAGDQVSNFFGAVPKLKELQRREEEMRKINQELMSEIISLQGAKEENAVLREAIGVSLNKDFNLEMAGVFGKDINQDSLFIDKGSEDGLSKDMPVITQQKVLLGIISEVYAYRSKVMLISNKNSSFYAEVFVFPPDSQENGISGLLKGEGGGKISLGLLSRNKEIKIGGLVVSSSAGGDFPSGLLVGAIDSVKKNDIDPFQEAEVSAFFSLGKLEEIFIILDF